MLGIALHVVLVLLLSFWVLTGHGPMSPPSLGLDVEQGPLGSESDSDTPARLQAAVLPSALKTPGIQRALRLGAPPATAPPNLRSIRAPPLTIS